MPLVGSGATSSVAYTTENDVYATDECFLTVSVRNTDFSGADAYVVGTTVSSSTSAFNTMAVHSRCSPIEGAAVDAFNFFECASLLPLPKASDGVYTLTTTASAGVDELVDGSVLHVEYAIACASDKCAPPSPPMSPPPSALERPLSMFNIMREETYVGTVDCDRGTIRSDAMSAGLPTGNSPYTVLLEFTCSSAVHQEGVLYSWGSASANSMNSLLVANDYIRHSWYGSSVQWTYNESGLSFSDVCDGAWHTTGTRFDGTTRRIFFDGVTVAWDTPSGFHADRSDNFCLGAEGARNTYAFTGSIRSFEVFDNGFVDATVISSPVPPPSPPPPSLPPLSPRLSPAEEPSPAAPPPSWLPFPPLPPLPPFTPPSPPSPPAPPAAPPKPPFVPRPLYSPSPPPPPVTPALDEDDGGSNIEADPVERGDEDDIIRIVFFSGASVCICGCCCYAAIILVRRRKRKKPPPASLRSAGIAVIAANRLSSVTDGEPVDEIRIASSRNSALLRARMAASALGESGRTQDEYANLQYGPGTASDPVEITETPLTVSQAGALGAGSPRLSAQAWLSHQEARAMEEPMFVPGSDTRTRQIRAELAALRERLPKSPVPQGTIGDARISDSPCGTPFSSGFYQPRSPLKRSGSPEANDSASSGTPQEVEAARSWLSRQELSLAQDKGWAGSNAYRV